MATLKAKFYKMFEVISLDSSYEEQFKVPQNVKHKNKKRTRKNKKSQKKKQKISSPKKGTAIDDLVQSNLEMMFSSESSIEDQMSDFILSSQKTKNNVSIIAHN